MAEAPIHMPEQFATQVKALRKARGLTQAQLGERLGVSQARVAEIESRPGVVGLAQWLQVLAALGAGLAIHEREAAAAAAAPRRRAAAKKATRLNKGAW